MKEAAATIIIILFIIFGMVWLVQGNDFFLTKVFAPKYEQVRRETFEQSKAYRTGAAQQIQQMQFEYVKSSSEQKAALASIILHRSAECYDVLPYETRAFVDSLKQQQTSSTFNR